MVDTGDTPSGRRLLADWRTVRRGWNIRTRVSEIFMYPFLREVLGSQRPDASLFGGLPVLVLVGLDSGTEHDCPAGEAGDVALIDHVLDGGLPAPEPSPGTSARTAWRGHPSPHIPGHLPGTERPSPQHQPRERKQDPYHLPCTSRVHVPRDLRT